MDVDVSKLKTFLKQFEIIKPKTYIDKLFTSFKNMLNK